MQLARHLPYHGQIFTWAIKCEAANASLQSTNATTMGSCGAWHRNAQCKKLTSEGSCHSARQWQPGLMLMQGWHRQLTGHHLQYHGRVVCSIRCPAQAFAAVHADCQTWHAVEGPAALRTLFQLLQLLVLNEVISSCGWQTFGECTQGFDAPAAIAVYVRIRLLQCTQLSANVLLINMCGSSCYKVVQCFNGKTWYAHLRTTASGY